MPSDIFRAQPIYTDDPPSVPAQARPTAPVVSIRAVRKGDHCTCEYKHGAFVGMLAPADGYEISIHDRVAFVAKSTLEVVWKDICGPTPKARR